MIGPERLGDVLARMRVQGESAVAIPLTTREGRARQLAHEEMELQIQRALWRAEHRNRRRTRRGRRHISWVHRQRRRIALEIIRWARSVGATRELAAELAERAALRFPRDGIILGERYPTPRTRGENPRARGTNPRERGTNPRARGRSPRQLRERGGHER